MSDTLISRLANCRAMAAKRLPAADVATIDDAIHALQHVRAEVAEQAAERVRATVIVEGETPAKLREAIAQRVADVGKPTGA